MRRTAYFGRRSSIAPVLAVIVAALMLSAVGCSTVRVESGMPTAAVSTQKLEYYPYQVKGYQKTYPDRTFLVLMPVDARPHRKTRSDAPAGEVPIGVLTNKANKVVQRLYSEPLPAIVQHAIYESADEAGFRAAKTQQTSYVPDRDFKATYVLQTRIVRCWVKKHQSSSGKNGSRWNTTAEFALKLVLYKPPFKIPFWQGSSSSAYYDPPVGSFGLGPEDEVGIYDHPGQDLSTALTRAVAGIFEHQSLHTLVVQDNILKR